MKITKNLPIYLLSASLLFVGVTSISQAQGATSTSSQILALQKQVKTLNSEVKTLNSESQNTHAFVNIIGQKFSDDITTLGDRTATLITTLESRITALEKNETLTNDRITALENKPSPQSSPKTVGLIFSVTEGQYPYCPPGARAVSSVYSVPTVGGWAIGFVTCTVQVLIP